MAKKKKITQQQNVVMSAHVKLRNVPDDFFKKSLQVHDGFL
jgi:hypothetical protein